MFVLEKIVVIDCPVETVFEFFLDPSKRTLWDPHVMSGRLISPPPLRVGSVFSLVVRQEGVITEIERTVTVYEQNRKFSYRFETKRAYITNHQLFEPQGQQTIFRMWVEYQPKGVIKWFTKPFAQQQQHALDEGLSNFKQVLEERCI